MSVIGSEFQIPSNNPEFQPGVFVEALPSREQIVSGKQDINPILNDINAIYAVEADLLASQTNSQKKSPSPEVYVCPTSKRLYEIAGSLRDARKDLLAHDAYINRRSGDGLF